MQVSKWGNSLAIRIPALIVEALQLKEGDLIEMHVAGTKEFALTKDSSREEALERLRKLRRPLPPNWKFDRADVYER